MDAQEGARGAKRRDRRGKVGDYAVGALVVRQREDLLVRFGPAGDAQEDINVGVADRHDRSHGLLACHSSGPR